MTPFEALQLVERELLILRRERDKARELLASAEQERDRYKRRLERIVEPNILRENSIRQTKLEEALREAQFRGEFKRGL